ncbi:MAG: hypothetical protein ACF8OB_02935 [Phycisphaeraceae bacterium JB051]
MSKALPNLKELKLSELLHVHRGCMVSAASCIAMGDDDVSEFLDRAHAVAAELHNRANPHEPVEVPVHRKRRGPGRPKVHR